MHVMRSSSTLWDEIKYSKKCVAQGVLDNCFLGGLRERDWGGEGARNKLVEASKLS